MAKILHIQSSPRKEESTSTQVALAMLEAYRQRHAEDQIETLDLFETDLPPFLAPAAKAKYAVMGGSEPADEAQKAWQGVIRIIDHFKAADKLVISSPMWNFGIPYRLKHYIDLIVQPGLTFSYDPETGYTGLVTGRPAALILSRGGDYSAESGSQDHDMQKPYLESILRYMGFQRIHVLPIQPTLLGGPDVAAQRLKDALTAATVLAKEF